MARKTLKYMSPNSIHFYNVMLCIPYFLHSVLLMITLDIVPSSSSTFFIKVDSHGKSNRNLPIVFQNCRLNWEEHGQLHPEPTKRFFHSFFSVKLFVKNFSNHGLDSTVLRRNTHTTKHHTTSNIIVIMVSTT